MWIITCGLHNTMQLIELDIQLVIEEITVSTRIGMEVMHIVKLNTVHAT